MEWLQIKIITNNQGIEAVSASLMNLGISGIEISDKEDFKEFLENNRKYWDYVDETLEELKTADTTITLYLENTAEGKKTLSEISDAMEILGTQDDYGTLEILVSEMRDEDWSENWKKYFKPIKIGEKVVIVPEWEEYENREKRTVFKVNPGMSFGTGSHESTQMCIEELEKHLKSGDKILDLGCGSGILSVIGLLLGAGEAVAVDIDPMAVETAYKNLELNSLSKDIYHGFAGDVTSDKKLYSQIEGKYDIVLANIVADVIIALSKTVPLFMHENSAFICSGIINERSDEVRGALENAGLIIEEVRQRGEWTAIVCHTEKNTCK